VFFIYNKTFKQPKTTINDPNKIQYNKLKDTEIPTPTTEPNIIMSNITNLIITSLLDILYILKKGSRSDPNSP
jgi:hypothetical protein